MSCTNRSVNGRMVWFDSSGQPGSVPVVIFGTWQLAQPKRVNSSSPASACGSSRLRRAGTASPSACTTSPFSCSGSRFGSLVDIGAIAHRVCAGGQFSVG